MVKYKIAISGKANSGKNTIASMFVEILKSDNSKEKIVALADPMKRIVKIMFPEALDDCLYGPSELRSNIISEKFIDKNGKPLTYRQALIDLGAFGRQYNSDIWLNSLVEDANKSNDIDTYIASDIRYCNEFYYLKNADFIMIRILRNDCMKIDDSSETEQDLIPNYDFDFIINNDQTIEKLHDTVMSIGIKIKEMMQ